MRRRAKVNKCTLSLRTAAAIYKAASIMEVQHGNKGNERRFNIISNEGRAYIVSASEESATSNYNYSPST